MAEGTTILLCEDESSLAEMYSLRLSQEGYTVQHANNGIDALKMVDEFHPHLIILDVMMPKLNGIDVFKALKDKPETKDIPVVIVTALVQEIDAVRQLMNPQDAYLIKSEVMPGQIIELIKQKLARAEDQSAAGDDEGGHLSLAA
jgi:two-component system phosphate regulon response regulator PhoB